MGTAVFILYLIALVYFLFFAEQYGRTQGSDELRMNLQPFREIARFWNYRDILGSKAVALNLLGNVIGFMPFGLVLPVMHRSFRSFFRAVLLTATFSVAVELLQLLTRTGSMDVDDLILNTLGGILGYAVFALCNHIRIRYYG